MIKKLFSTLILFCFMIINAQDIITLKKEQENIKAKVLEITDTIIKYKSWDNIDGPIYNLFIKDVVSIKYKNGKQDIFAEKINTKIDKTNNHIERNQKIIDDHPSLNKENTPKFVDNSNQTLKDFEIALSNNQRQKAGAWGKTNTRSIVGTKSNIRFSKKNIPKIVIQLESATANPYSICELALCQVKERRTFIDSKEGMGGIIQQERVKIDFKKLDENGFYEITLPSTISKGEYFFMIQNSADVFAFAID